MPVIQDVVSGAIKLNSFPDRACFSSWGDFITQIPSFLSVEIPASISNVLVGTTQPTEDDREKLWLRRSTNGSFIGWYVFSAGAWAPFYNIPRNQVVWMFGDSSSIEGGFVFIDTGDPVIVSSVVTALKGQYIPNGVGGYSYFAVRYEGP